ncbi:MAG: patatin-like phospholipase family protein [Alphaproteobacteria bacterium]|nr:patatin-like phospholipase family protein [Alphaproteobacteria bacterium]
MHKQKLFITFLSLFFIVIPNSTLASYYNIFWNGDISPRLLITKVNSAQEGNAEKDIVTLSQVKFAYKLAQKELDEPSSQALRRLMERIRQPEDFISQQASALEALHLLPDEIISVHDLLPEPSLQQELLVLRSYYRSFIDKLSQPSLTEENRRKLCSSKALLSAPAVGYFKLSLETAQSLLKKLDELPPLQADFDSPHAALESFLFSSTKHVTGILKFPKELDSSFADVSLPLDEEAAIEQMLSFEKFLEKIDEATLQQKELLYQAISPFSFARMFISSFLSEPFLMQFPALEIQYNMTGKGFIQFASSAATQSMNLSPSLESSDKIVCGFRNPLYLLEPLLQKECPFEVKETFTQVFPEVGFLKYATYFNGRSRVRMSLLPLAIERHYQRWQSLSLCLNDFPYAKYEVILAYLHPLVAQYFKNKRQQHLLSKVYASLQNLNHHPDLVSLCQQIGLPNGEKSITQHYKGDDSIPFSVKEGPYFSPDLLTSFINHLNLKAYTPHHCERAFQLIEWVSQNLPQDKDQPHRHKSWQDPELWKYILDYKCEESVVLQAQRLGIDTNKLEEQHASQSTRLHQVIHNVSAEEKLLSVVKGLLQADPDLENRNDRNQTPLDLAFVKDLPTIVSALIEAGAGHYINIQEALKFYKRHPDDNSLKRLQKRNQHFAWEYVWDSFRMNSSAEVGTSSPQGLKIKTVTRGTCILPQALVDQLFPSDLNPRQLIPTETSGNSAVAKVIWKGFPLYFKEAPAFPGLEYAVSQLMFKMAGFGAPFSEFAFIGGVPYLISQGIEGQSLLEVVKEDPSLTKTQWHEESLFHTLMMSMITFPEDGRPINYIVQPHPDKEANYRLVCVDNDQSFVSGVAKETTGENIVQVKSFPFCFPQMHQPIPLSIQNHYGNSNQEPYALLSEWLKELENYHIRLIKLARLRSSGSSFKLTPIYPEKKTYFGVPFQPNMLGRLYERMKKIYKEMNTFTQLTPFQVLEQVDWLLSRRYIPNRNESPKAHFGRIEKSAYELKSSTTYQAFRAQGIMVSEVPEIPEVSNLADDIKNYRQIGPHYGLDEVLKKAHDLAWKDMAPDIKTFQQLTSSEERACFLQEKVELSRRNEAEFALWLGEIEKVDTHELFVSGNDFITHTCLIPQHLELFPIRKIFLSQLHKLDVSYCSQLDSNQLIKSLALHCKHLQILNLSGTQIKHFSEPFQYGLGVSSFFLGRRQPLVFESLRWLLLNDCAHLKTVGVRSPLERLRVKNCSTLNTIDVKESDLKRLALEGTSQLPFDRVNQWIQQRIHVTLDEKTAAGAYGLLLSYAPTYPLCDKIINIIGKEISNREAEALAHNPWIVSLNLTRNKVGDQGVKALAQATALTALNLNDNQVSDRGAEALAKSTTLTTLDLGNNIVGDQGAKILAGSSTLTSLNLEYNSVGDQGAETLARNTILTFLNLDRNHIGMQGAEALAQNTTLTALDLGSNIIGDQGVEGLARSSTLKSLNLGWNNIREQGASNLAQNTSLIVLHLEYNQIGNLGASTLAKNSTLILLDLERNNIDSQGAEALAQNTILTSLSLSGNKIGDQGANALARNTTLTSLDLRKNKIGDQGAEVLAKNTTLTSLDLRKNKISDQGAEALAKNTTLISLNLKKNKISDQTKKLIKEVLQRNQSTTCIQASTQSFPSHVKPLSHPHIVSSQSLERGYLTRKQSEKADWVYTGLSLDGGGVRGLIPALMAAHLEDVAGKPLYKMFDYIGGTSVGGILSLAFSVSNNGYTPLWSTSDVVKLFSEYGNHIFPQQSFGNKIMNPAGLLHAIYDPRPLENLLKKYYGNCTLEHVLTNVLVTGVVHGIGDPFIFDNRQARIDPSKNFYLTDIGRATSAAPTYFPAAEIWNVNRTQRYTFNDGGMGLNDPTPLLIERLSLMAQDRLLDRDRFFVLSLGTGDLEAPQAPHTRAGIGGWVLKGGTIINEAMEAPGKFFRQFTSHHFQGRYYRLQPSLYWGWNDPLQEPPTSAKQVLISEAPLDNAEEKFLKLYEVAAKHMALKVLGDRDNPSELVRQLQINTDRKAPTYLGVSEEEEADDDTLLTVLTPQESPLIRPLEKKNRNKRKDKADDFSAKRKQVATPEPAGTYSIFDKSKLPLERYIRQLALLVNQPVRFQAAFDKVPAHFKEELLSQLKEREILRDDSSGDNSATTS